MVATFLEFNYPLVIVTNKSQNCAQVNQSPTWHERLTYSLRKWLSLYLSLFKHMDNATDLNL